MNNKEHSIVDLAKSNKLGLKLQIAVVAILTVCYIIQGSQNSITTSSLIILLLTMWIPIVASQIAYRKNPASELIKHFIGVGYGLFYVAVCLLSDQQLVFTYAFPMVLVIGIYCDLKFSITVGSACIVVSIVHAIIFAIRSGLTPQAIAALEIQIAATALVCIYNLIANKFVIDLCDKQMKDINEVNVKTENMLAEITKIANNLADEVTVVSEKMKKLAISSEETLTSMQEVQSGTTNSAEAVEGQLHRTEDISNQIENVSTTSENITKSVNDAVQAINAGRQNISQLMAQAKECEEAGAGAVKEVNELKTSTDQMGTIIELINNVARQTSLLALNASIEAARAGEAGRGFAVVAGEISNLAGQTQGATKNISDLIENLSYEMGGVSQAIGKLVESNKVQNESAKVTSESFEQIVASTNEIKGNANSLSGIVSSLERANEEIVESIQTISAITEEVNSHSTVTLEVTDNNQQLLKDVQDIVGEMITNADTLKNM